MKTTGIMTRKSGMKRMLLICLMSMMLLSLNYSNTLAERNNEETITSSGGLVSYQGTLMSRNSQPLTGTFDMVFSIYSEPTGGNPIWVEERMGVNAVPVQNGLFNLMLGSLVPLPESLASYDELFLGITIGTDSELTPRTLISVNNILSGESSALPVGTVISWWKPNAGTPLPSGEWMIADGSIVSDSTSPFYGQTLPDLRNKFIMGVTEENIGVTGGTNSLNLAHDHQVTEHTHSIPSHSHSGSGLYANVSFEDDRAYVMRYGPGFAATNANYTGTSHANTHITEASAAVGGQTGAWSGTTGSSSATTNSALTTILDNRPAYIGLIYLIKVR